MSGLVRERLLIALRCAVALEVALDWTIDYVAAPGLRTMR